MYHNILIPTSFDTERDISTSLKLAKLLGTTDAQVTLLHVIEEIPAHVLSSIPEDFQEEQHKAIQVEMDALTAKLTNAKGLVIEGHAGRSILNWADTNKPDLIILASHRPDIQDFFLGTTANEVVRHANCAVHVVR